MHVSNLSRETTTKPGQFDHLVKQSARNAHQASQLSNRVHKLLQKKIKLHSRIFSPKNKIKNNKNSRSRSQKSKSKGKEGEKEYKDKRWVCTKKTKYKDRRSYQGKTRYDKVRSRGRSGDRGHRNSKYANEYHHRKYYDRNQKYHGNPRNSAEYNHDHKNQRNSLDLKYPDRSINSHNQAQFYRNHHAPSNHFIFKNERISQRINISKIFKVDNKKVRINANNTRRFVLNKLIDLYENQFVEFKRLKGLHLQMILNYICGFLNSFGGALYIGIADDGLVKGIALSRQDIDQFQVDLDRSMRLFHPKVFPEQVQIYFHEIALNSKKQVGFLEFFLLI